jgi:hypothetical protein
MGEDIAHEVNAAALPCRAQHLGDSGFEAFVGIGDHELDASQSPAGQLAQELRPDRLGFGCANFHAEHLAPAVGIDAHGDDDGNRDNASAAADLQVGRVDPQIGPIALDGAFREGLYLRVDLLAEPADLALRDAAHAHRLDQVIHRTGRDALDVGLLDNGGESLLGHAPRFEEAREVGALSELGNAQLDGPRPRLPVPLAVAVALYEPQWALLAVGGSGGPAHLHLHQPLGRKADHLTKKIGVGRLLYQRTQVHYVVGHRSVPRIRLVFSNPTLPANYR